MPFKEEIGYEAQGHVRPLPCPAEVLTKTDGGIGGKAPDKKGLYHGF